MNAYVLAGGASRRMGRDKALIDQDGVPMAVHLCAVLERAGFSASVIRRLGQPWTASNRVVWEKHDGERHPLCGVLTALDDARAPVVVIPCDLPNLTFEPLRQLWEPGVAIGDRVHPLVAHVPWTWRERIARAITTGASAQSVLGQLPPVPFPPEQLFDRNR